MHGGMFCCWILLHHMSLLTLRLFGSFNDDWSISSDPCIVRLSGRYLKLVNDISRFLSHVLLKPTWNRHWYFRCCEFMLCLFIVGLLSILGYVVLRNSLCAGSHGNPCSMSYVGRIVCLCLCCTLLAFGGQMMDHSSTGC